MSLLLLNTDSLGFSLVPLIFRRTRCLIFCLLTIFVIIFCILWSLFQADPQQKPYLNLFTSSLTSLLAHHFTNVANTFALVRLGLAEAADLGSNLADELLVDAFERDLGVLPFVLLGGYLQLLGN